MDNQLGILRQCIVGSQQVGRQDFCLGDQHAVEGIAVVPGQVHKWLARVAGNWQLGKASLQREVLDVLRRKVEVRAL